MNNKSFGNFDRIKEQMEAAKNKAEQVKGYTPIPVEQEQTQQETFLINLSTSEKATKKVVNYYLTEDLIKRIKAGAKIFKKKDSNFLEEVMDQVLKSMGI